jgi:histidine ammonia-lyase
MPSEGVRHKHAGTITNTQTSCIRKILLSSLNMNTFHYGSDRLTVPIALDIAAGRSKGVLHQETINRINASQQHVQRMVDSGKTVYGVTTGFGILADKKISEEETVVLQYKILQSHSVGVGDPIVPEIAKLMMITKVHALAQGYSGIQLSTVERIIWHIDSNIIPLVPEKAVSVLPATLHHLRTFSSP